MASAFKARRLGFAVLASFLGLVSMCNAASAQEAGQSKGLVAEIKARGVLKVGIAPDPPFEDRLADGTWVGYLPALETKFAESLGVKIEFIPTTFTSIVAGLQAGKYDMAGADLHATEERKKAIDFSDPFYASGTSFFLRPDQAKIYKTVESLNDAAVTIAVIGGSSDETVARATLPKARILALPNVGPGELVLQVKSGKVTATGLSSYFGPALEQRFSLVARPDNADGVGSLPEAWGIRKNTPELTEAANKFLVAAKKDGTIAALKKRYLSPEAFLNAFSLK
jgi:ABC-type amino acid transport substrate-binding protein